MKNIVEKGALYIVSTPIGNLQDISLRALEILKTAEVIFAEDTRVTHKLLAQYAIKPPQIYSCHEHNEKRQTEVIDTLLQKGQTVALVSDAGTPLICDPGYYIVHQIREKGYRVIPIPGASALISALSAAGLPSDRFQFLGFLPAKSQARENTLTQIKSSHITSICYESTHRIIACLEAIDRLMPKRYIVLAKELTKRHEQFFFGQASEILAKMQADPRLCKGEFVLLFQGSDHKTEPESEKISIRETELLQILSDKLPIKQAVELAVKISKGRKNDLYKKALKRQAQVK